MSEDTFGCCDLEGKGRGSAPGIQWEEAGDAAEHATKLRTAPSQRTIQPSYAEAEKLMQPPDDTGLD